MIVAAMVLSLTAIVLSVLAAVMGGYAIIMVKAMEKSTHTMIQTMAPIDDIADDKDFEREMVRSEEAFLKFNGDDQDE